MPRPAARSWSRFGAPARVLEVLEEVRRWIEDHHVGLVAQALAVGLEAAVEAEEFGIAVERLGIDARGLRVALALGFLRVAISLGDDHLALAIGVGLDLFAFGLAGRAQLVGDALPLGLHAAIDVRRDLGDEVDALQAHIDDRDADAAHVLVHLLRDHAHDRIARSRNDVVHCALGELRAQRVVHGLRDARLGRERIAAHRHVVLANVDDAPLHERVDEDVPVLGGKEAFGIACFEGLDARVEEAHVLQHRHEEIQARIGLHRDDLAQLELDRGLALVDRVHANRDDESERKSANENRGRRAFHRPASRSRERRLSRRDCSETGGVVAASGAATGRDGASIVVDPTTGPVICINWFSGRYSRFPPPPAFWSTMTLLVAERMFCMVSRYMRSRVTCGAFSYSARIWRKRDASPWAVEITLWR